MSKTKIPTTLFFLLLLILFPLGAAQQDLPPEAREALRLGQETAAKALTTYSVHFPDKPLWKEAIKHGIEASRLAPERPEPYRFLAQVYSLTNWYIRAWQAWNDFQKYGGELDAQGRIQLAEASAYLAQNSFNRQNYQAAIPYDSTLLTLDPGNRKALERITTSYLKLDDPQDALPYLTSLAALDPSYRTLLEQVKAQLPAGPPSTTPSPPLTFDLKLAIEGPGTVTLGTPAGNEECRSSCTGTYDEGTVVTLTATPDADSDFGGWGGACSGVNGTSCRLSLNEVAGVVASFLPTSPPPAPQLVDLDLILRGAGRGTITSSPPGIACAATTGECSGKFPSDMPVVLRASPGEDSEFASWGGACAGAVGASCTLTIDAARNVTAAFRLLSVVTVTTTIQDTGDGLTGNDAEEFLQTPVGAAPEFVQGTVAANTRAIDFSSDFDSELAVGLRFENLDIPPGAEIVSASVQFTAVPKGSPGNNKPLSLTIRGQNDPNPPAFIDTTIDPGVRNDITGRPTTSAAVDWNDIPKWSKGASDLKQKTPDLSEIIQEIIDLPGWKPSGNAIVLIFSRKSGDGLRRAADRRFADERSDPTLAARITITYR